MGIGSDIIAVHRIDDLMQRYGDRFLDRCFRPAEKEYIQTRGRSAPLSAAARWAAKEALLKALGTNVQTIPYRDVEVVRNPDGPVSLQLHGKAAEAAVRRGAHRWHLALSHEKDYATATVILENDR